MTEIANQQLTPAQEAIRRAQETQRKAAQRPQSPPRERASPEEKRRAKIVDEYLSELTCWPNLTFIACLRVGNEFRADCGPNFPAIADFTFHLHRGLDVAGGRLAGASAAGFSESESPAEASAMINNWMARLQVESIEYLCAWHVCGEPEVHLAHTSSFDNEVFSRITELIHEELCWQFS